MLIPEKPPFRLEPHELMQPLWLKIEIELKGLLEDYRSQNDQNLDDIDTARLRGRIATITNLLGWSDPPRQIEDAPGY